LPHWNIDARLPAVKNPWKPLKWAVTLVGLALAVVGFEILRIGGVFQSLDPGVASTCRKIALGGSAKVIQVDRKRGIAYLSLLDRDGVRRGEQVPGSVMLLDLNLPDPAPRAAMAYEPAGFRPEGMSLLIMDSQPARLFVVSQHPGGAVVEIAEEGSTGGFFPRETIRNDAFIHAGAIAATGARQFYLTNVTGSLDRWTVARQALHGAGRATLIYFDGTEARVEAADLQYPAGLALSPDGSRLYVADTLARQLRIYRRDAASGALEPDETIDLDSAPGNLDVDDDGMVWIAAYPKLFSLAAHLREPGKLSPTQVLRFDPKDRLVTVMHVDAGAAISAGSTAVPWRDEFLIGAPSDPKVLLCKASH
jgi:arylesterase/paraoxonase